MENDHSTYSFGPNWLGIALLLSGLLLGITIALDLNPAHASVPAWVVGAIRIGLVATPLSLLCWLLSSRLAINAIGLRCRSLFGHAEMRWDEVDEFYLEVRSLLLCGVIPVGMRHHFTLKSGLAAEQRVSSVKRFFGIEFTRSFLKSGTGVKRMSFGDRFSGVSDIAELIHRFTFPLLWSRAIDKYNRGLDVTFGGVLVSRNGIAIDTLAFFSDLFEGTRKAQPIGWSDVQSYGLERGIFKVCGKGEQCAELSASLIPNVAVLMTLLGEVKPQREQPAKV